MKGCNSINSYHPTIEKLLIQNNYDPQKIFNKHIVKVYTLKEIIEKYNISSFDKLKIDTEGHDTIILNHYLHNCNILPKYIKFECNDLNSKSDVNIVIDKAIKLGYKKIKRDKNNCILIKDNLT